MEEKKFTLENINIDEIVVKEYIPILLKKQIIDETVAQSVIFVNGIFKIDFILKEIVYNLMICNAYSNINVFDNDKDIFDIYDELKQENIIKRIFDKIPSEELHLLDRLIKNEIYQKIKTDNSIENIVAQGIERFIEKIPDNKNINKWINKLTKSLKNFDPEKLEFLNKVKETLN